MSRLGFKIEGESSGSAARAGVLTTLHGEVQTPVFMPVGTNATVKNQTVDTLKEIGSRVLLANTYHLLLRPGAEVFEKIGGIHRFMNWDGPVLTDSGGFQIFSLPLLRKMEEAGARFQSYLDGTEHLLSPEVSIRMQRSIGSDIMMVLDQCIPSTAERPEALAAMELTHRWAKRSLDARGDSPQSLFGIVQGACFEDLRKESARVLTDMPFDGFAIGGLAVGEGKQLRDDFTAFTAALLPRDLPRYLMGVGTPLDILEAVHRGVDMFDCILPSQLARRGAAFTSDGKLQLRRTQYRLSEDRLDKDCPCDTCAKYSRAYLHHLYKCGETLGWRLLTVHNLTFYHRLMREMRREILAGTFATYYARRRVELAVSDNTADSAPKARQRSSPVQKATKLLIETSGLRERIEPVTIWNIGHDADLLQSAMPAGSTLLNIGESFEESPSPDLVFYDPAPSKMRPELWSAGAIARLYARCFEVSAEVFTTSASTAVRASLLAAGFWVGRGICEDSPVETTIAVTHEAGDVPLLDATWLARWQNTQAKLPGGGDMLLERRVATHPQWQLQPEF